ncbi:hypothetical protein GCM10010387_10980 [Streptomyces inusitatus]|uniref:Uncharacterized protein n=1 Tax=Streptomyces inusitatus TaxID=68221 RepID=A0A918UM52_9ACTN|nr:hypothetical protein [Streptomyces inusitatus]GGZ19853.1 hypothetical protein GCM10010387_10980 [Streptomyces inusitatus]
MVTSSYEPKRKPGTHKEAFASERVRVILRILEKRRVPVRPATRERIVSCTDLDTLSRWLERALTVAEAEGLFGEGGG